MTTIRFTLSATVATILLGGAASAGDFYVDAVNGDDTNSGISSGSAWRTITHALASVPDPPWDVTHTIHVAPGVYDPSLGEVFPLVVPPNRELVGTAGESVTVIDGVGTSQDLVSFTAYPLGGPLFLSHLVQGFTLRNAANGVFVREDSHPLTPVLRDLEITGMSQSAVEVNAFFASVDMTMERVVATGNGSALLVFADYASGSNTVLLRECDLIGNAGGGASLWVSAAGIDLTMERCRIEDNGGAGLSGQASLFGGGSIHADDVLVAGNGSGLVLTGDFDGSSFAFHVERSTIAHNTGAGVSASLSPGSLDSSIVFGNGDDIIQDTITPTITAAYTDVGDGDFAGLNGNFSADPMFRDAAAGDYRLSFGSPCLDSGDPASPGVSDLAGVQRPIDGDLDTDERTDVGAFELQPLSIVRAPRLGEVMALGCWGAMGDTTQVWASRAPLVPPMATALGELDLDRPSARFFGTTNVGPAPPGLFLWTVPDDPALAGMTLSVQALTDSAAAPMGRAWTNPLSFVIEP